MSHGQYKATMIVNYVTIFIKSNLYESDCSVLYKIVQGLVVKGGNS